MTNNGNLEEYKWKNKPQKVTITHDTLNLVTEPLTDLWQRTYYDFRHDNAHAFVKLIPENEFSFSVKTFWEPKKLFDQCGVIIYHDAENWFKASVEYENDAFSRLGSVVTNLGYSDWATTDIDSSIKTMVYRLSRRNQDFLIENSLDGILFKQMRIFHMHQQMAAVNIGVYACSPLESSFEARFSDFSLGECEWDLYKKS